MRVQGPVSLTHCACRGVQDVSQNRGCRIIADSMKQVSRGEGEEKNQYWILSLCLVSGKTVKAWANNKEQRNHRGRHTSKKL